MNTWSKVEKCGPIEHFHHCLAGCRADTSGCGVYRKHYVEGGVSSLSDYGMCDNCDASFFWEGVFPSQGKELCHCCLIDSWPQVEGWRFSSHLFRWGKDYHAASAIWVFI